MIRSADGPVPGGAAMPSPPPLAVVAWAALWPCCGSPVSPKLPAAVGMVQAQAVGCMGRSWLLAGPALQPSLVMAAHLLLALPRNSSGFPLVFWCRLWVRSGSA